MLADCLMAWRGERDESIDQNVDARVAAIRVAEFINAAMATLTKKR